MKAKTCFMTLVVGVVVELEGVKGAGSAVVEVEGGEAEDGVVTAVVEVEVGDGMLSFAAFFFFRLAHHAWLYSLLDVL